MCTVFIIGLEKLNLVCWFDFKLGPTKPEKATDTGAPKILLTMKVIKSTPKNLMFFT
jgi:hypothetical protein